jgi:hypothetical protein
MSVTFQIQVTPPPGVGITDALVNFGDGNQQDLGGLNGTVTVTHAYKDPPGGTVAGTKDVSLKVTDTLGRTTTGTTTVTLP